ncbi:MAG: ATP-binding protein [Pseudomonadota bacterium]
MADGADKKAERSFSPEEPLDPSKSSNGSMGSRGSGDRDGNAPSITKTTLRSKVLPKLSKANRDAAMSTAGKPSYWRKSSQPFALSRLTFTIAIANLVGLMILLLGSFAVTEYRENLVIAKLEGVRAQAQIVADVIAQVAIDTDDCQKITQPVFSGEGVAATEPVTICARNLREEDVRTVFNRIWDSFEGRIRIFRAPEGGAQRIANAQDLLLDDVVLREDKIQTVDLAPIQEPTAESAQWRIGEVTEAVLRRFMTRRFRRAAAARTIEQELAEAIRTPAQAEIRGFAWVRMNENGELVASVSIPIRRVHAVYGVVTSEIGGIDQLVGESRTAILPFFGLAILAAILSSLLLTAAIAQPIRQLAIAADKVREGISAAGRARIPDFSYRQDEIGELSGALKAMTQATYDRIDTIESFAADVAHELKNPLTSIRSATETLEIAKKPEARDKLMGVIKQDVARMDRLITDISNASRLDAELARQTREAVDINRLLDDIVDLYRTTTKTGEPTVSFEPSKTNPYLIGNATALGQVVRNLIDNAKSFSPSHGSVRVSVVVGQAKSAPRADAKAETRNRRVRIYIDDDGPGIPEESLEKIFSRFYTKRPAGASFGNNSGLGLAICRQITESHGGRIWAENRLQAGTSVGDGQDTSPSVIGARFVVELPIAS